MEAQKPADAPRLGKWFTRLLRGLPAAPQLEGPALVDLTPAETAPLAAWMPEPEVSDVSVAALLTRFLYEVQSSGDDTLRCRSLAGLRFRVVLREGTRMLHVMAWLPALPPERRAESEAAALAINDGLLFGRAAIDSDGDLVLDTCLSYAGGLVPQQLLHTLALFERSCVDARAYLPKG